MKLSIILVLIFSATAAWSRDLFQACPESPQSWSAWRETLIATDSFERNEGLHRLNSFLDRCEADPSQSRFFRDPQFRSCIEPLRTPVLTMNRQQYLAAASQPELYSLPAPLAQQSLWRAMGISPDAIRAELVRLFATIPEARLLQRNIRPNQDPNSGPVTANFIVMIPGQDFDRWFNISERSILMLGIQKNPKHRAFFSTYLPDTPTPRRHPDQESIRDCTSCHRTGGIPILEVSDTYATLSPLRPNDDAQTIAAWMNQQIAATGNAENVGVRYGDLPALGDNPSRTLESVRDCAQGIGPGFNTASLEKIQRSMNCVRCHSGDGPNDFSGDLLGKITYPLGPDPLVKGLLASGHMPPGAGNPNGANFLNPLEREALSKCLIDEYYGGFRGITPSNTDGILIRYLRAKACPSGIATSPRSDATSPLGSTQGH